MQDEKLNEIAGYFSKDSGLTEENAGFEENNISSKSRGGRFGEWLEENHDWAEENCGQKEKSEQGFEFNQEPVESKKRGSDRASGSNQTCPQSQEEINEQDRNIGDFKGGAYWENYSGQKDTLEGKDQWSCHDVKMEMPYKKGDIIIAWYKGTGEMYDRPPNNPCDRISSLITKYCLPANVTKKIEDEKKILERINRIEEGLPKLSKRIEKLAKTKKPCIRHSQKRGFAPQTTTREDSDECKYFNCDDEDEDESEDESEDDSSEDCLDRWASKFSGSIRSRICKDDETDSSTDLGSALEDLCKRLNKSTDMSDIEEYGPSKTGKRTTIQDDKLVAEEEEALESQEEEQTKTDKNKQEEDSEESTDEAAAETNDEETLNKEETNQAADEENKVQEKEECPEEIKNNKEQPDKINGKRSNYNDDQRKVETTACYSEEFTPYLIKKPDGIPRSVQRKLGIQPGECGLKKYYR